MIFGILPRGSWENDTIRRNGCPLLPYAFCSIGQHKENSWYLHCPAITAVRLGVAPGSRLCDFLNHFCRTGRGSTSWCSATCIISVPSPDKMANTIRQAKYNVCGVVWHGHDATPGHLCSQRERCTIPARFPDDLRRLLHITYGLPLKRQL